MNYLHHEFNTGPESVVEVVLDHAANVQLLDEHNFQAYRSDGTFNYVGGYTTRSPFRLWPPYAGRWHLVVDLGGAAGSVRASVRLVPAGPKRWRHEPVANRGGSAGRRDDTYSSPRVRLYALWTRRMVMGEVRGA